MKVKYLMFVLTVGLTCISGQVYSHGNVIPQGADSSAMPDFELGDESDDYWVFENPYRSYEGDVKDKVVKFGESAYGNNCAGCHGLQAISGGINPDLRLLSPDRADDDLWFVELLRNGTSKGMPALGGIPEGSSEPILDQKTLWAIKSYLEVRREVAIEDGDIDAW